MDHRQAHWNPSLGALLRGDNRCQFCVWAPEARSVELHLIGDQDRYVQMERGDNGYFRVTIKGVQPGQRYQYRLDGGDEFNDPASRAQPDGVYAPSAVLDPRFDWHDSEWTGNALQNYIIYELHVGTYTPEGTFDALIPHLDTLVDLGVTALELMPITQFPGDRNWGYDGVFPFAVQNSYGGAPGLKRLVDACHQRGLAVVLDVVYNHFGPEGSCITRFGPYTTDNYETPWGEAINMDGEYSDEVRHYFIENALYWIYDFHIDALRLDATHFIYDFSAQPFMQELAATIHDHRDYLRRNVYLIAENDRNDASVLRERSVGGWHLDALWNDDFHHALHTLITREDYDYYKGFGSLNNLVKAMREGFVFSGQYSEFRKRRHGTSSLDIPGKRFIIFLQNHDQIGNRMPAERLHCLIPFELLKLGIGVVALSPYPMMMFMGDEYAEPAHFNYFTSFQDEGLIEAIRKGRKEQFGAFIKDDYEPPDPQAEATFHESKLDHALKEQGRGRVLFAFYRTLFCLRKTLPALYEPAKERTEVLGYASDGIVYLRRWYGDSDVFAVFNFNERESSANLPIPVGYWCQAFRSTDPQWREDAAGSPPDQQQEPPDESPASDPIQSLGELSITVPAHAFVIYTKQT